MCFLLSPALIPSPLLLYLLRALLSLRVRAFVCIVLSSLVFICLHLSLSAQEIESDFLGFVTSSEVDEEGKAKRRSAAAALVDEVSDLEDRQLCAMDIVRVSKRISEKRLLPHLALSVEEANEMIYEARLSSDAGNHRQFYQVRARGVAPRQSEWMGTRGSHPHAVCSSSSTTTTSISTPPTLLYKQFPQTCMFSTLGGTRVHACSRSEFTTARDAPRRERSKSVAACASTA